MRIARRGLLAGTAGTALAAGLPHIARAQEQPRRGGTVPESRQPFQRRVR